MIVRTLGRTNYKVSTLGLGMYQLTGQYGVAPDVADKSIDYGHKAIKLSEELNLKEVIASAYKNTGIEYYFSGQFLKTILFSNIALKGVILIPCLLLPSSRRPNRNFARSRRSYCG